MTRKEQIKILNDKIKANNAQYKIDRLNAEISAFSSGDLNKYEFLTRKDLNYKPNALDKAKFEFSPLGNAFSMGLDKTAEGYQEEGVIKLLKDIRDDLADCVIRQNNRLNRPNDNDDNDDDNNDDNNDNNDDNDDDNNDDNDDRENRPNEAFGSMFLNNLNNLNNIQSDSEYYARLIANQNTVIKKLEEDLIDRKNLTKEIKTGETINKIKKECLEYYNKYKQNLFEHIQALKQLNNAESVYGRETGILNDTINNERIRSNELRDKIQELNNIEQESSDIIAELSNKIDKLKNKKTNLKFIKDFNNDIIRDMLNKFRDNMETDMNNLHEKVANKKN